MSTSPNRLAPQDPALENPLAHLPYSAIVQYRKGSIIYDWEGPPTSIYLVVEGRVRVSRVAINGRRLVLDIYQTDEFLGESAFLKRHHTRDLAVAMEDTKLMGWTAAEIESLIAERPRLGVALLQLLVHRNLGFAQRIEGLSTDTIGRRLACTLIEFSERLAAPEVDGWATILPLTHKVLSEYLGTSREIVTSQMNRFRRDGYVKYSRQEVKLRRSGLLEWLRQDSVRIMTA
jgi:CRP/FNR family transcriptional regulator, cyclic AMP receptor protein